MNKIMLQKGLFVVLLLLCMSSLIPAPAALVGGFLFTLLFGHPYATQSSKWISLLLKISVVGLGFGMNLGVALQSGKDGFWLTVSSILLIMVTGFFLGKMFKLPKKTTHLVSSGTAICGGSAIAAVAPAVKADENEISVSLGVVFLLNSIALIAFPILGHYFGLTQHQFGLWSAIAIHDTSSVVGAASAYGEEALMVATTVKLARALWIIPLSIFSAIVFKSRDSKISIPWFIFLFVVAMTMNTYIPALGVVTPTIFMVSKLLLVVTLFLIGASLSVDKIKKVGFKPLILGVLLWIMISILSLLAILYIVK
ncbi:MAG: YeiH family protein [Bacteroidales bacterium]